MDRWTGEPERAELNSFIVRAKAATYMARPRPTPTVTGNQTVYTFESGDFAYSDRYFGSEAFVGQELVSYLGTVIWGMNYFGLVVGSDPPVTGSEVADILRDALGQMYAEGRFLGGFQWSNGVHSYSDHSVGDVTEFRGEESIRDSGHREVYRLAYHGGLVRDS